MIAVKDENDNIGLLTECEWMEATERMEQVLIKTIEKSRVFWVEHNFMNSCR